MAEKKKKGFLSRIKDSLKIKKKGLSGANLELKRKRGRTLKSNTKMASFREDTKANQKLQAESKDARKDYTTYTKVNKTNKKNAGGRRSAVLEPLPSTSRLLQSALRSPAEPRSRAAAGRSFFFFF